MLRIRFLGGLASCLFFVACGGTGRLDSGGPDTIFGDGACPQCVDGEFPDGRPGGDGGDVQGVDGADAVGGDAIGSDDGNPDGGGGGDAADGGSGGDGAGPDALPMGPCAPVADSVKVAREVRVIARPVYVQPGGAGFVVGNRAQRLGLDNVFLTRMGTDGASQGDGNVSELVGPLVEGGSIAADGTGYVMAFSSNDAGNIEVYVRRVSSAGAPTGAAIRVTNDAFTSQDAQIVASPGGWIVVWRSRDDGSGAMQLLASAISSGAFTASAPIPVTATGVTPGSFDVASDGTNVAVSYVSQRTATGELFAVPLMASGAPNGAPMQLTTGTIISDTTGAAIRGADLAVVWAERGATSTLHLRHANVTTRVMDVQRDVPTAGFDLSKPSIAVDGTGFVVAFRRGGSPLGTVQLMRFAADLTPRDGASRVDDATTGDIVRIAARGDGTYIVGWADDFPTGTIASVRVIRCP